MLCRTQLPMERMLKTDNAHNRTSNSSNNNKLSLEQMVLMLFKTIIKISSTMIIRTINLMWMAWEATCSIPCLGSSNTVPPCRLAMLEPLERRWNQAVGQFHQWSLMANSSWMLREISKTDHTSSSSNLTSMRKVLCSILAPSAREGSGRTLTLLGRS